MDDNNWIEIARTGIFTDSAGRRQTFTERDLDDIARAYDPAKRDAPLCFGHPQTDKAPAFGWVDRLKSEGGRLYASFSQVPDEVRELVARGHYRHVSMSLMPDRVSLRHVALLGAAQPAIDGLAAVEFSQDTGAITVDFTAAGSGGPRSGSAAATALAASDSPIRDRTLRAGASELDGGDAITVDFAAGRGKGDSMTTEELQRQVGQLQAQLEALKAENATLKKQAETHRQDRDKAESARNEAEQKAEKASADFAAYREKVEGERREARVSELVKAGKVKPAEKASVLDFAAKLAELGGGTVDFAAPDGKTESLSMEERYFRELGARPVDERAVDFAAPDHDEPAGNGNINPADLTAKL